MCVGGRAGNWIVGVMIVARSVCGRGVGQPRTPCVVCCHPHVLVVIAATGGTVTGSATAPRKHCLQENISESGSVGGKK